MSRFVAPNYPRAIADVLASTTKFHIWSRIGWAEIRRRYRRTVFGPFWSSISLAIFATAMGLVWANLWNTKVEDYLPFLVTGLIVWMMLTAFINEGCLVFVSNENLIKQFPINFTMLVLVVIWRNLIIFAHNLLIYVGIALFAGVMPTFGTLLIIPGLFLLCLNGVWIGLFLGILCARYRDIQQVVASLLQISMFVTPIFWTPSQLSGRAQYLVDYNLLYHYVSIVRDPLLGKVPSAWTWTVVVLATIVGWSVALYFFARFRRRIAFWV